MISNVAFAALIALATAHDSMDMDMAHNIPKPATTTQANTDGPMSYFAYGKHSSSIIVHIALMVVAWCFILPAGESSYGNRPRNQTFKADLFSCNA